MRTRQEGGGTAEVDREAALHAANDRAIDRIFRAEGFLETIPAFLAARLVARDDGIAERIFDALEVNFHFIANGRSGRARAGEFPQRDPAFGLQTDIDGDEIILDRGDAALDDSALGKILASEAGFQHRGEIIAGRGLGFGLGIGHGLEELRV